MAGVAQGGNKFPRLLLLLLLLSEPVSSSCTSFRDSFDSQFGKEECRKKDFRPDERRLRNLVLCSILDLE
jgi:hypothetical protein